MTDLLPTLPTPRASLAAASHAATPQTPARISFRAVFEALVARPVAVQARGQTVVPEIRQPADSVPEGDDPATDIGGNAPLDDKVTDGLMDMAPLIVRSDVTVAATLTEFDVAPEFSLPQSNKAAVADPDDHPGLPSADAPAAPLVVTFLPEGSIPDPDPVTNTSRSADAPVGHLTQPSPQDASGPLLLAALTPFAPVAPMVRRLGTTDILPAAFSRQAAMGAPAVNPRQSATAMAPSAQVLSVSAIVVPATPVGPATVPDRVAAEAAAVAAQVGWQDQTRGPLAVPSVPDPVSPSIAAGGIPPGPIAPASVAPRPMQPAKAVASATLSGSALSLPGSDRFALSRPDVMQTPPTGTTRPPFVARTPAVAPVVQPQTVIAADPQPHEGAATQPAPYMAAPPGVRVVRSAPDAIQPGMGLQPVLAADGPRRTEAVQAGPVGTAALTPAASASPRAVSVASCSDEPQVAVGPSPRHAGAIAEVTAPEASPDMAARSPRNGTHDAVVTVAGWIAPGAPAGRRADAVTGAAVSGATPQPVLQDHHPLADDLLPRDRMTDPGRDRPKDALRDPALPNARPAIDDSLRAPEIVLAEAGSAESTRAASPEPGSGPAWPGLDVTETRAAAEPRGEARLNAAAPDLPRQIALRLSEAPAEAAGEGVELRLSPEELGPVRLTLRQVDGQMTVMITVERPETLDLMRRHVDQLLQDMRSIGYASVRLDMQAQGDRQPAPPPPSPAEFRPVDEPPATLVPASVANATATVRASGGLDLRF